MRISYVLPVYNCCEFNGQTIESLLNQTHKDFEIIVIDDASDDDICFIKEFYKKNDKIIWDTNVARGGGGLRRNFGNQLADGDIIAVCDAGDLYHHSRGKTIEKFFSENPNKDIFYSDVAVVSATGRVLYQQKAIEWGDKLMKPPISHPTVAYRSKVPKGWINYCYDWDCPNARMTMRGDCTCKPIEHSEIIYHTDSLNTDFYEFFMIDAKRAGYKFGFSNNITCLKLGGSNRDIQKAKDEKYDKYRIYGIDIKREDV